MDKIIDYEMVEASFPQDLKYEVKRMMAKGYVPYGKLLFSKINDESALAQPMVKFESTSSASQEKPAIPNFIDEFMDGVDFYPTEKHNKERERTLKEHHAKAEMYKAETEGRDWKKEAFDKAIGKKVKKKGVKNE